jgi:DNA-binding response OmpR family regulator
MPGIKRVLIVDNNAQLRYLMNIIINEAGYETLQAPDALQALRAAETQRIDLLLTDFDMPGMNGVDLIRTMRDRGLVNHSLIVTGEPGAARERLMGLQGTVPLLAKPFTLQDLLVNVQAVLHPVLPELEAGLSVSSNVPCTHRTSVQTHKLSYK